MCEQCWQQQTDVRGWEFIENTVFQNCKREFLSVLGTAMDVQSRNILSLVDTCVTFLQDMSFFEQCKDCVSSTICTSMLQCLDVNVIKCSRQHYGKQKVRKLCTW
jgi:hypothetical protein